MKIKEISQHVSSTLNSNNIQKEKQGELEFQKLLKDANVKLTDAGQIISSSPCNGEVKELSSPPSASSVSYLLELEDVTQIQRQSIQATEDTLETLKEYEKAMSNPLISLKKIDPLIQSLSQRVDGLNILSEKLSPSDPLKKILTEAGIISAVEIEKFRRGEYI